MRQVMEGFESEFESLMTKKKALEADMAEELEIERKRIEKKYSNRSATINNMLALISFEVPEEEVVEEKVEEEVKPEEDPAGIATVTGVENEPVEKEVVETSVVDVVEKPVEEKALDPTPAQPSPQVKKVLF